MRVCLKLTVSLQDYCSSVDSFVAGDVILEREKIKSWTLRLSMPRDWRDGGKLGRGDAGAHIVGPKAGVPRSTSVLYPS